MDGRIPRKTLVVVSVVVVLTCMVVGGYFIVVNISHNPGSLSPFGLLKPKAQTPQNSSSTLPKVESLWEVMRGSEPGRENVVQVRGKVVSWEGDEIKVRLQNTVQSVLIKDQVQYKCMPRAMGPPNGGSPVPLAEAYINYMNQDGLGEMMLTAGVKKDIAVEDEIIILGLADDHNVITGHTIITMKCGAE